MPHREIQEIISAMADRQEVSPGQLERVRDHCKRCPECAAFATAVAQVRSAKPPRVPRGLAARIVTAVAAEIDAERALAAAQEAEAAVAEAAPDLDEASTVEPIALTTPAAQEPAASPAEDGAGNLRDLDIPWLTRERLWTVMASVGASAAIVLIAVFVSGRLSNQAALTEEVNEQVSKSILGGQTADSAPQAETAASPPSNAPAATAPPFVVFAGKVYSPSSANEEVTPSSLATAGTVVSAMSTAGSPASLTAYTRPGDRSLLVRRADGTFAVCAPVTRSFGGLDYHLNSGVTITRYGSWPRLPADIPEPTSPAGSPSFIAAGNDSSGAKVYARMGGDTKNGIGVAPGAASTDPGGGNPYWTWWTPVQ